MLLKKSLPEVTCWGTGKPYREFLHVNDLGDAVIFSLENWDPESEKLLWINMAIHFLC